MSGFERLLEIVPKRLRINALSLLGIAGLLLAWWLTSVLVGSTRLPPPWVVFRQFFLLLGHSPYLLAYGAGGKGILPHLWQTLHLALAGGIAGTTLGLITGLAMGWSQRIRYLFEPPIEVMRTIPPLAAIPFLLMWLGPGVITQFVAVAFFCFFRFVIYTIEAIHNVPPIQMQFAMTLGATRSQAYRTVILPAITPELVGGLRVMVATIYGIEVVAELMGAEYGVGRVFSVMANVMRADDILATVVWVALMAVLTDLALVGVARRVTRWVPKL